MKKTLFLLACILSLALLTSCADRDIIIIDTSESSAPAETTEVQTPQPAPVQTAAQQQTDYSGKINEFNQRASEIDEYDRTTADKVRTQADINIQSGEVYQKWDELLNDIYQYLKSIKPASEFENIKNDEVNWIREKENAAAAAAAEYEGGSMAPMVFSTTAAEYTKNRCYYLISLIY